MIHVDNYGWLIIQPNITLPYIMLNINGIHEKLIPLRFDCLYVKLCEHYVVLNKSVMDACKLLMNVKPLEDWMLELFGRLFGMKKRIEASEYFMSDAFQLNNYLRFLTFCHDKSNCKKCKNQKSGCTGSKCKESECTESKCTESEYTEPESTESESNTADSKRIYGIVQFLNYRQLVIPWYTKDEGLTKYVPTFFFDMDLSQHQAPLEGWDVAHFKFCLCIMGVNQELYSAQTFSLISLADLKEHYLTDVEYVTDIWPTCWKNARHLIINGDHNTGTGDTDLRSPFNRIMPLVAPPESSGSYQITIPVNCLLKLQSCGFTHVAKNLKV